MTTALAVASGGTRGIGLALSRRLISLGHHVVGLYHRDAVQARAAAAELGERFTPIACDVADPDQVTAAVEEAVSRFGAPRVLVNNAGLNIDKPFADLDVESWRRVVDVNLTGPFLLTKAVVPHMAGADDPVIVNIGATTGIRPRLNGANYCASKAGLLQLTKCLALELAPHIRVNCLIPGMTETAELRDRFNLDDPASRKAVLGEIPLDRIGTTENVADALEFLVSKGSSYISGQRLIVDGGQFMW